MSWILRCAGQFGPVKMSDHEVEFKSYEDSLSRATRLYNESSPFLAPVHPILMNFFCLEDHKAVVLSFWAQFSNCTPDEYSILLQVIMMECTLGGLCYPL